MGVSQDNTNSSRSRLLWSEYMKLITDNVYYVSPDVTCSALTLTLSAIRNLCQPVTTHHRAALIHWWPLRGLVTMETVQPCRAWQRRLVTRHQTRLSHLLRALSLSPLLCLQAPQMNAEAEIHLNTKRVIGC